MASAEQAPYLQNVGRERIPRRSLQKKARSERAGQPMSKGQDIGGDTAALATSHL